MKIRVEVSLFAAGEKANLYAVRLIQHSKPEVARFFDRILDPYAPASIVRLRRHLQVIFDYLNRISKLDGAQERFFRPREGRGLALPIEKGDLRLYCYRLSDKALILCGGGIKQGGTVQESPDCLPHFNLMNSVIDEIKRRKISPAELLSAPNQSLVLSITPPSDYDVTR